MSYSENKKTSAQTGEREVCYQCNCPHGQYRTAIMFSWACVVLASIFQIICGCISAVLTTKILYVCVHFVGCILVYGAFIWVLIRITKGRKKLVSTVYESSMARLPILTGLAFLISVAGIIFQTLYSFAFDEAHNIWIVILCYVLHLFSCFAVFAARLSISGLPFKLTETN